LQNKIPLEREKFIPLLRSAIAVALKSKLGLAAKPDSADAKSFDRLCMTKKQRKTNTRNWFLTLT
jgi:hypothetical protein